MISVSRSVLLVPFGRIMCQNKERLQESAQGIELRPPVEEFIITRLPSLLPPKLPSFLSWRVQAAQLQPQPLPISQDSGLSKPLLVRSYNVAFSGFYWRWPCTFRKFRVQNSVPLDRPRVDRALHSTFCGTEASLQRELATVFFLSLQKPSPVSPLNLGPDI